jgi:hypothetical protein
MLRVFKPTQVMGVGMYGYGLRCAYPRHLKQAKNSQNSWEMTEIWLKHQRTLFCSYLSHFSTALAVFGLILTGKPCGLWVWVCASAGTGQGWVTHGLPATCTSHSTKIGSEREKCNTTPPPPLPFYHPDLEKRGQVDMFLREDWRLSMHKGLYSQWWKRWKWKL